MPVRIEKDDEDNTSYENSSDDSGSSSSRGGLFSILGMIFRALFGWFFSRRS